MPCRRTPAHADQMAIATLSPRGRHGSRAPARAQRRPTRTSGRGRWDLRTRSAPPASRSTTDYCNLWQRKWHGRRQNEEPCTTPRSAAQPLRSASLRSRNATSEGRLPSQSRHRRMTYRAETTVWGHAHGHMNSILLRLPMPPRWSMTATRTSTRAMLAPPSSCTNTRTR